MYRAVKSYVLRAGRVSKRQQFALDNWLPDYALTRQASAWDLTAEYGREAETIAEIGFGMGSSLLSMAQDRPEVNFLGIEVHRAGVGSLVADLHEHALSNVRVAAFDAVEVFEHCLADHALAGVQIFFPDPWPKKRHHKRRILNDEFVQLLVKKIKAGGFIHCATDWQEYAEHMLACLSGNQNLLNQQPTGGFSPRPETRPLTKFEQRGTQLGHGVWDLMFTLRSDTNCSF